MPHRLSNRLRFLLERLILRGALSRLLVIALVMGAVVLVAGFLAWTYAGAFETPGEAFWWAFLRMTDPGYLGDDEGAFLRAVSTFLTVAGFVLFVGALIAILTQWLNETIESLEAGYTPVAMRGHIVILGWTNRTAAVVQELVLSEGRLRRFLQRHGTRGLRVAILADAEPAALLRELRERLGDRFDEGQVIIRSGTPLRLEHLTRVDFLHAAAVLLPGADFVDERTSSDTQVIKTLLSMTNHPAVRRERPDLPLVVAEVTDESKVPIARRAYGSRLELLTSDAIISRLIAQNVRHQGLSRIYEEIITHNRGNELYVREHPDFIGRPVRDLHGAFPEAVLLGIARPHGSSFHPLLDPLADITVEANDRLVLLARSYEAAAPRPYRGDPLPFGTAELASPTEPAERRVLLLGWNHRVPALLLEFDSYADEGIHVDVLSLVPTDERERLIARYGVQPEHAVLTHFEGDYNALPDLRAVDPASYDNIVLLGSDWLESGAESDARTILGHLFLRDLLADENTREHDVDIITELLDPENLPLFRHRATEVLISPLILSHMLAQVVLRPELRAVFDELFGPGGPEITFAPAGHFGLAGAPVRFGDVQRAAAERGAVALGLRLATRVETPAEVRLNPDRAQTWTLSEKDDLILLTTRTAAGREAPA